ncbi:hypothetical protein WALSEDRAFT_32252 [Wallemia mellicola CBS 633.66]|uniref:Uncharacterized protein n=1 Tax=Wallemia mellicola (strain ATCC MYA-4683 / CBS 633.66) TaxID=671144 RepID=I4YDQ6_WALMC|nr:hypothetical protein WALSEDRAFT_32252 [Wallemia mellicola CBS 633.66]EIM22098.1 hypothetical protein WALSEDRAFT_32252 [Wallemia mellicola CBS 633.66]|eukprot:XP_006957901.1 hypothetical protein WALSEDRAFT_32252 [Wallemia mellicola CBS 633.66]
MFAKVFTAGLIATSALAAPVARSDSLTSVVQGLGSNSDFTSALSSLETLNSQDSKPTSDDISSVVNQLTSAFKSTNDQMATADTSDVDPNGLGKYLADDIQNIVNHLSPTLNSVVGEDLGLQSILQPLDDEISSTLSGLESDVTNVQKILYGALNDLGLGDVADLLNKTLNGELPGLLTSIDNELNGVLEHVPVVGDLLLSLGL